MGRIMFSLCMLGRHISCKCRPISQTVKKWKWHFKMETVSMTSNHLFLSPKELCHFWCPSAVKHKQLQPSTQPSPWHHCQSLTAIGTMPAMTPALVFRSWCHPSSGSWLVPNQGSLLLLTCTLKAHVGAPASFNNLEAQLNSLTLI